MPPKQKTPKLPPNALKKLDVHVVSSERYRGLYNELERFLSYMFVDVVIKLKITVLKDDTTEFTVYASLTLQNKVKRSCKEVLNFPSKNNIMQKLYEFCLSLQLQTEND